MIHESISGMYDNFPKGEAICLINVDDKGQLFISEEARECLSEIKEPVAVLAVCGKFRSGKSSLLSSFVGRKGAFEVSHKVHACTKGIRMYSSQLKVKDHKVILLDTEGLMATDSDSTHDAKIFALSILLSSAFIYNVSTTIDETTLSTLRVVIEFASMMMGDKDNASQLAQNMPQFNVLVRDFSLELERQTGEPMSATEWLEETLSVETAQKCGERLANVDDKVELRKTIKEIFPERKCYTLPRPSSKMGNIDISSEKTLNKEFVTGMRNLKTDIVEKTPVKQILSEIVTGNMLLQIAEQLVNKINEGSTPRIRDSWALVVELQARDAADSAIKHMCSVTANWANSPMSLSKMKTALGKIQTEARQRFEAQLKGKAVDENIRIYLNDRLEERYKEVYDACAAAKNLEAKIRIQEHINTLRSQISKVSVDAPEKWDVVESFIRDYLPMWKTSMEDTECTSDLVELVDTNTGMFLDIIKSIMSSSVVSSHHQLEEQNRDLQDQLSTQSAEMEKADNEHRKNIEQLREDQSVLLQEQIEEVEQMNAGKTKTFTDRISKLEKEILVLEASNLELSSTITDLNNQLVDDNDSQHSNAALESEIEKSENLKNQLEEVTQRAEKAELNLEKLRTDQKNNEDTLKRTMDEIKTHTDVFIASKEEGFRKTLEEKEEENSMLSQRVATLTASISKLEGNDLELKTTIDTLQASLGEEKKNFKSFRTEERKRYDDLQGDILRTQQKSAADLLRQDREWADKYNTQTQEKSELELQVARLTHLNSNGKRELERANEYLEENKRLKREHDENKLQITRMEASNSNLRKRLEDRENIAASQSKKVNDMHDKQTELERRLAVEEFKNTITWKS